MLANWKRNSERLIIADVPIEISGFGSDEIDQVVIGGKRRWDTKLAISRLCLGASASRSG